MCPAKVASIVAEVDRLSPCTNGQISDFPTATRMLDREHHECHSGRHRALWPAVGKPRVRLAQLTTPISGNIPKIGEDRDMESW